MTGWVVALLPAGLCALLLAVGGPIAAGAPLAVSHAWIPSLGIGLSLYVDGLGLMFGLLITGIGALVAVYAGGYLAGHAHLGRFYVSLLAFMVSMLGVVVADNVILLFVFWELTSLTSYLLIGFEHEEETARAAALQALLVTGAGGLALLAGLLLLGQVAGTLELSALLERGDVVRAHPAYLAILLLVLAGAFTKSAQVPFHFWLPSAMAAPTPVSAYLHSATMVKAGVYLLARLSPVLGDTEAWRWLVAPTGALTMLVGAVLAVRQTDLKRILAYTTVSALGTLTMLLGVGTALAISAALVFLLAHALYKGALFLVAGAVEHETGTRDASGLGGLARSMPITAAAAGAAAVSMIGLPPALGYLGKELVYEAAAAVPVLAGAAVLANVFYVAAAGIAGVRPFVGPRLPTPTDPHEAPPSLWLGPVLLGGLGLLLGLVPGLGRPLLAPAAAAVLGQPVEMDLALWHGFNLPLLLSVVTLGGAAIVYAGRDALRRAAVGGIAARLGPARAYERALDAMNALARGQTRVLQNGYLRYYLLTTLAVTVGLAGYALLSRGGLVGPPAVAPASFFDAGLAALILLAGLTAAVSRSRFGAVAALGVVGYGMALVYALHGAPDLAMTQIVVDTLTIILFVLVFYHLPRFTRLSSDTARLRDLLVSLAAGGLLTALTWAALESPRPPPVSGFFVEQSVPGGHGRNIVNVILVDFRALDTLGEIVVLALAALGVFALLRLRPPRGEAR
ncbi:MAG: putative monovalent cation/H+ antiporter subunit A [Candidatus Rokubacteria bacterium]|nr:putative monovalent cation/H+ antiporter subunit A [Candidatus Rokubacteria bacterium]